MKKNAFTPLEKTAGFIQRSLTYKANGSLMPSLEHPFVRGRSSLTGFTILEIMIAIIVVGILSTLGLPYFQNVFENSKLEVCRTNLEILQKGLDIYVREHGTVPGSLSELRPEHLNKAYAQVMSGKDGWKKQLAYFIVEGPKWGLAYAQGYGFPHLKCPNNPDKSPTAVSYGLNLGLLNMTYAQYKALPKVVMIADSDAALFYYPDSCPVPGSSIGSFPPGLVSYDDMLKKRAHKRYQLLSPPEVFLEGVTEKNKTGKIFKKKFEEESKEEDEDKSKSKHKEK
ncbi:MAG: prepilin-type N-terminal cleavage/methylation domain-containing protein [Candidatus Omnitrophota bacterium]